jgi:phosphoribosylamine--glycine ligase
MAERWQSKKILVVGAGGREHALCWALAKSNSVEQVLCMPGNGGTESENKCKNEQPRAGESLEEAALRIARDARCDFAVIGPEEPLARGLADTLRGAGISAVGPGREGAMLEASKDFAKRFMARHGVACAQSETFDSARAARQYFETLKSGG